MIYTVVYIFSFFVFNSCLCSVILSSEPYCTANGDSNTQHVDPGTSVSITCAVDNDGLNALSWTIPSFGVNVANVNGADGGDDDQPDFRSTVNSFDNDEDTTNATLTFTAVTALDGAVVNCADSDAISSNCTLSIVSDVTSPPLGISCSNINTTHITLSWEQPTDNVGQFLEYEVSISSTNSQQIFTISDINYTFNNLSPFTQYTFTVRTNNSIGLSNANSIVCTTRGEVFNPLSVDDIEVCLSANSSGSYIEVNVSSQPCPPSTPTTANFTNFTITISGNDPNTTTSCQYERSISVEMDYNIIITVNNEEGSSEPTTVLFGAHWIGDIDVSTTARQLTYSVPDCFEFKQSDDATVFANFSCNTNDPISLEMPYDRAFNISSVLSNYTTSLQCNYTISLIVGDLTVATYTGTLQDSTTGMPTDTTVTPINATNGTMTTSTTDPTPSDSPTKDTAESDGILLPAVGGVIGGVILILVIVITVIVGILLYKKCSSGKSDGGKHSDPIPLVQKNIPETGQTALYQDPSTIEREKAPTGDVYALPDKSSKQRRPPPAGPKNELPTYQDPNTIQRQVAPSGDMYAMPEKKKQTHAVGGMYAELDHMGPTSPTQQPLLHETQPHQPVVYSAVRHN